MKAALRSVRRREVQRWDGGEEVAEVLQACFPFCATAPILCGVVLHAQSATLIEKAGWVPSAFVLALLVCCHNFMLCL